MAILFRVCAVCIFLNLNIGVFGQTSSKIQQLVPYRIGYKWGFSDLDGAIVVQPKYDEIDILEFGRFKIKQNYKWGLADRSGEIIVPIEYKSISEFGKNGSAKITGEKGVGIVDTTGKILVPAQYTDVSNIAGNLFVVMLPTRLTRSGSTNIRKGIYRNGKLVLPVEYTELNIQASGAIFLRKEYGEPMVLIVKPEAVLLEKRRLQSDFSEGLASIDLDENGTYEFITEQRNRAFNGSFRKVNLNEKQQAFNEGLAAVSIDGVHFGYIDRAGKVVIPFEFEEAKPFERRTAIVRKNGRAGLINREGKPLVPYQYDHIYRNQDFITAAVGKTILSAYFGSDTASSPLKYSDFSGFINGFTKVKANEKFGFINLKGEEVIPCIYDAANEFSEGLVAVRKGEKWGFIDLTGATVIPFNFYRGNYDSQYSFHQGRTPVMVNYTKCQYIDLKGNKITEEIEYGQRKPEHFYKGFVPILVSGKAAPAKYTIIDLKGKPITSAVFNSVSTQTLDFGLINVCQESGCGFIDPSGKTIIPLEHKFAYKELGGMKISLLYGGFLKVLHPETKDVVGYMSLAGKKYWQD